MANSNGVLAVFSDPEKLKRAAALIRDARVQKFDAITPFPVHGIEEAMGLKRSFLPWVTFIAGLTGCIGGMGFQIWSSAYDWALNVGGKPYVSIPAFIPVGFETTILCAGLATAGALILVCGLPRFNAKILDPRFTNDHFGLWVSSEDREYDEKKFMNLLKGAGADDVRTI